MSKILHLTVLGLMFCAGTASAADETGTPGAVLPEIEQHRVPLVLESGRVSAPAAGPLARTDLGHRVIYAGEIEVPGASAVRVVFDTAVLDDTSYVRITSQLDGHVQTLRAEHLAQWAYTSAYFNGDVVSVEILAAPGSAPSEIAVSEVIAEFASQLDRFICGRTDDRLLSSDPRAGRVWPSGCTAWMFNGRTNCLITAGHCGPVGSEVIEFNVPLSTADGTPQHPGPSDQYSVDPASIQTTTGGQGVGNDWATFGVFDNPVTGLSPLAAAGGQSYTLAAAAPGGTGQSVRVTGYGRTTAALSPTWNGAQKTHAGPYKKGTATSIRYSVDTTEGNSGSPVEEESTGLTIGVHTHGGCRATGGANQGTASWNAAFQSALNNPQGVCDVGLDFDFVVGTPDFIDAGGATSLTVEVTEDAGVTLDPATVTLHYNDGLSTVAIPMATSGVGTFVAAFPGGDCGETGSYFVSASTQTGADYRTSAKSVPIADTLDVFADFDFEADPSWSVGNTEIVTGSWERAIPRAEGRGDPLTDFDGSGRCWVTDNGLSADVDGGPTVLTTASIDLSSSNDPVVSYARWHHTDDPGVDNLVIQFSDNAGASWTTVETITATTGWVDATHRVADHVAPTSQFQVRWSVSDNPDGSTTESAVDAFRVVDIVCNATCSADCDGSGAIDHDDLDCFVAGFLAGDLSIADCDANGTINIDDIDCFVASFLAGCP